MRIPSKGTLNALLDKLYKAYEITVQLIEGKLVGYFIVCPNCHEGYQIKFEELNYDKPITCMKCGHTYKQNENIEGVVKR